MRLTPELLALYRDHDGSDDLPDGLSARLMPLSEVREVQEQQEFPPWGVTWLWTDDNSNYVGLACEGFLDGYLVKFDHEESVLKPAWRTAETFLRELLWPSDPEACDVIMLAAELPVLEDDPRYLQRERDLAARLREAWRVEPDNVDLAVSSMALTPVVDSGTLLPWLNVDNPWIPEAALQVLHMRRWPVEVAVLERLILRNQRNADIAAMLLLASLDTPESRQAVSRLRARLGPGSAVYLNGRHTARRW